MKAASRASTDVAVASWRRRIGVDTRAVAATPRAKLKRRIGVLVALETTGAANRSVVIVVFVFIKVKGRRQRVGVGVVRRRGGRMR